MGNHRVEGSFKGLARRKEKPVKAKITGTLGKIRRQNFRKALEKLAKRFGLKVKE